MSEELQKLSENVHDGYFLVSQSMSLGKWRWEYYVQHRGEEAQRRLRAERSCAGSPGEEESHAAGPRSDTKLTMCCQLPF